MSPPSDDRLPHGFAIALSPTLRRVDGGRIVIGGSPPSVLKLAPPAMRLLSGDRLEVHDAISGGLARRLLDAGVAHPVLPPATDTSVTVVVPVKDNPGGLDRLLLTLRRSAPEARVIVVDDGSTDAERPGALARRNGARLLRHETSRGPSAARNTGLAAAETELVAFCDSDVVPDHPGWLAQLAAHFADPAVALVAPRILAYDAVTHDAHTYDARAYEAVTHDARAYDVAMHHSCAHESAARDGWLTAYERAHSSLDLGPAPALVRPTTSVAYVPSAVMVARVAALDGGFDADLRVAEDVDLVFRLHRAGWRMRYQPDVTVSHEHRTRLWSWLGRKAYYGTGAAPLARRHPGDVPPVRLSGWTALTCLALLAQRRWSIPVAVAVWAITTIRLRRTVPLPAAARLAAQGGAGAAWQVSVALTRHWWPAAAVGCLFSRRLRRAASAAALVEALVDWYRYGRRAGHQCSESAVRSPQCSERHFHCTATTSAPHPAQVRSAAAHMLTHRLDDLAYGAGVWWGALRHRTLAPLLPQFPRRDRHAPGG